MTQTPEEVDFFRGDSEELLIDPFSYFAELRGKCPVRREPHHNVMMVTGYDEARAVFGTRRRSRRPVGLRSVPRISRSARRRRRSPT